MSLPVTANSFSPVHAERLAAPPRSLNPSAANPGASKAPIARATGGEVSPDRAQPLLSVKQATESEPRQKNLPAGPSPSFEESILERQARVALEFPPVVEERANIGDDQQTSATSSEIEQARQGFTQARTLVAPETGPNIDLRG